MAKPALSQFERLVVVFENRPDGGLRVYSDDVPGFVLSHRDAVAARADVIPALEGLIGDIVGYQVRVEMHAAPPSERETPAAAQTLNRVEYRTRLAA